MVEKIKLQENLYVYRQTNEPSVIANTYVLMGSPNILIDAGFMVDEKIEKVILTHSHFDHSKNALMYQDKGAKILASNKAEKELLNASQIVSPEDIRKMFNWKIKKLKINQTLEENQIIENENFKLKVISVPGHTPCSIALYDEKKQILFSGDTWFGGERVGRTDLPGGNSDELKKSVEKLKKLKPKLILPGHQ